MERENYVHYVSVQFFFCTIQYCIDLFFALITVHIVMAFPHAPRTTLFNLNPWI